MTLFNLYIIIKHQKNMKKTKTKTNITVALNSKIKEYLIDNIENSSKYIEYLIIKDLVENNVLDKKEFNIL